MDASRKAPPTVLLVGVDLGLPHFDAQLHELGLLAQTAGLQPVARITCKRRAPDAALYVGTGKAEQVTSVVYRLVGPDELAVDVSFAPDSKEKGFTSNYTREGKLSFAPPEPPKAAETKLAKPAAAGSAGEAPKPAAK